MGKIDKEIKFSGFSVPYFIFMSITSLVAENSTPFVKGVTPPKTVCEDRNSFKIEERRCNIYKKCLNQLRSYDSIIISFNIIQFITIHLQYSLLH